VTARRATAAIAVLVVVIEGYFLVRYLAFGALFHLYVHGLLGVGLALAGHAAWRARRPGGAGAPELLGVALAGHIASAVPDVLFLTAEIPHAAWMDVFVAHISIHFVPAPLALTFAVLAAGVAAQVARVAGAAPGGRARRPVAAAEQHRGPPRRPAHRADLRPARRPRLASPGAGA
jgi:hypothetical protein